VIQADHERRVPTGREQADDLQFQCLTQEMRLLGAADVDPADDSCVLRKHVDQALFLEAHQRIAHRCRADAELAGKLGA
jgi:hypothetical protein